MIGIKRTSVTSVYNPTAQNCTAKSPAVKSCSKREGEKNAKGANNTPPPPRAKNTPPPTRRRHVPTAVASRLLNRTYVCAVGGGVYPEVNRGKAPPCTRIHYPCGASGYLESPIVTVYFAADVEAHFFLSFSSLFPLSPRLSLSQPIFLVTGGDEGVDDILTEGRLRFLDSHGAFSSISSPPSPRAIIAVSFYFESAQRPRNTIGLPALCKLPRVFLQLDMKLELRGLAATAAARRPRPPAKEF